VLNGTTEVGGASGFGMVFSPTPPTTPGGDWSEQVLYSFTGRTGAGYSTARLQDCRQRSLFGISNDNFDSAQQLLNDFRADPAGGYRRRRAEFASPFAHTRAIASRGTYPDPRAHSAF